MKTINVNGIDVKVSDKEYSEYLKEQKQILEEARIKMKEADLKEIKDDNEALNQMILDILKTDIPKLKRKALSQLLTEVKTREELDYKHWLFNNGKLRSDWEVEEYKLRKKRDMYKRSSDFDTSSKITNITCFSLPFLLGFACIMSKDGAKEAWIITVPVALFVALFFSMIGIIIGHSINIHRGLKKGLDESDVRLRNERNKRTAAIINATIAGASVYKKAKSAIKEIGNPESWEEMK